MLYTRQGDDGTSMLGRDKLGKSDARFALLGDIDELGSHIGFIKSKFSDEIENGFLTEYKPFMDTLQAELSLIAAGVYDPKYRLGEASILALESEIDKLQGISRTDNFVRAGGCELSAVIDICRCVARRAERSLCAEGIRARPETLKYINRLSDFLFALARYADFLYGIETAVRKALNEQGFAVGGKNSELRNYEITPRICREVSAAVEERAAQMKLGIAIAFCDPAGRPLYACSPRDALIVSFDYAIRKAYTASALKMTTAKAQELIRPGGIFYGLTDEKLLPIPGGAPIVLDDKIIGAIGVSGGDDRQDAELAGFGLEIIRSIYTGDNFNY